MAEEDELIVDDEETIVDDSPEQDSPLEDEIIAEEEPAPIEPDPEPVTEPEMNEEIEENTTIEVEEEPNNGRKKRMSNANKRMGINRVMDVVFYDIRTQRPTLMFDSLKVSNIENAAESNTATGGAGNSVLVEWDHSRTATLTMQDALISTASLSALAGTVEQDGADAGAVIHANDKVTVASDGSITTENEPIEGTVVAYEFIDGAMGEEVEVTGTGGDLTVQAEPNTRVIVFYQYLAEAGSSLVTFSSKSFPSTYKVVGTTLMRDQDGYDYVTQFLIPKAKLQAGFTLTMDSENVSTFDFNLNIMKEKETDTLYKLIRLNN